MEQLRDILNQHARNPSREPAALDAVMRALVEHDDWYVPVTLPNALPAADEVLSNVVIFADPVPPPAGLVVFSDRECALRADGQPLGLYRGGVAGTAVFGGLDPRWGHCAVNPYSEKADQWYVDAEAFEWVALFAQAVGVERALIGSGPFAASATLLDYDAYMIAVATVDGTLVELPVGERTFGVIFTARDQLLGFLDAIGPDQATAVDFGSTSGDRLVALMASAPHLDGLLVNPYRSGREHVLFREQFGG